MIKNEIKLILEEALENLKKHPEKSRETSITITKLEEAIMWLEKDIEK